MILRAVVVVVYTPQTRNYSVLGVLAMAIAEADFGSECLRFPEHNLMRLAYEELHARQAHSEMRRIGII